MKKQNPIPVEPMDESNWARQNIVNFLRKIRFKRSFLGVSEADVWKKIQELDALYEKAIQAERQRYEVLLEEHQRQCAAAIKRLKAAAQNKE